MKSFCFISGITKSYLSVYPKVFLQQRIIQFIFQKYTHFGRNYSSIEFQPRNSHFFQRSNSSFSNYERTKHPIIVVNKLQIGALLQTSLTCIREMIYFNRFYITKFERFDAIIYLCIF